ncbi:MAG: TIGR04283 family arsenosugar biosynthesis glycosyltransferase [Pseudomonadota bacterium]
MSRTPQFTRQLAPLLISVIIPALNAAPRLSACLNALVEASIAGVVKEVIVMDGGSSDDTLEIADGFGARIETTTPGRGRQLAEGARLARNQWLLFLHGDTVLEDGWRHEAEAFMQHDGPRAGVFSLCFDATGAPPRIVVAGAMARTHILRLPYGDQGLLISRETYESVGGYRDLPLMEDVDFMQRFVKQYGRGALSIFKSKAVTSAARYEDNGYARQVLSNGLRLVQFLTGVKSAKDIAESYSK